jgi:hypothetical protein
VIKDEMGRRPEKRRAMLGCDARGHAPRSEELCVKEYASRQVRHSQYVG